ncbi:MAG TPA: MBL fold metallo-hydrolase [Gemmatimonadales bacterium]|nr:MBL fold metallo-hydrolase [Gemmatimonadales bacterium]
MSLTHTFTVGELRCHTLEGGIQRLDGGAMFGVVPRPLWERRATPDARHRIQLALRCLLIEHPGGLVLVDTGIGDKDDEKFRGIYGIENRGVLGRTQLDDALAEVGHAADEVRWVLNTHLHFDHAGGDTVRSAAGMLDLAFPNATYVVQRGELAFARLANERNRASYLPDNFEPVDRAGRWQLVEGDAGFLPGISLRVTPGHVPFHQSVVVRSAGETAIFLGDVVPTTAHVPLAWIMGYDVEPLRTLESKRALYAEALAGDWLLVFEHDPRVATARLDPGARGLGLRDVTTVGDTAPVR